MNNNIPDFFQQLGLCTFPHTSAMCYFGNMVSKISVFSINFYQQYISPYKGYCWAHRILHGGDSCSQYVKKTFFYNKIWLKLLIGMTVKSMGGKNDHYATLATKSW
jgi:hypothetical protein